MKKLLFISVMVPGTMTVIAQTSVPTFNKNDPSAPAHKIVPSKTADIKPLKMNSAIRELRFLRNLRGLRALRFTRIAGYYLKDDYEVDFAVSHK